MPVLSKTQFYDLAVSAHKKTESLGKVVVVYGGETTEREVSINSGQSVASALQKSGVLVETICIERWQEFISNIASNDYKDCIFFNLVHGSVGENGCLHGCFEMLNIPYVGSSLTASALSMNKLQSKRIAENCHIKTPPYALSYEVAGKINIVGELPDFPLMIKPVSEGSSNGLEIVREHSTLEMALQKAHRFESVVLIEKLIEGSEITVPIFAGSAWSPIEIVPKEGLYDYHAKYISDETVFHCPPVSSYEPNLCRMAEEVFRLIEGRDWGRVDFMIDEQGNSYFLEINLIPGMTSHSLVPQSAIQGGLSFEQLVCGLVKLAKNHIE